MSHMGLEGMSLNIKNTQDRFELFMMGIQFLQPLDKKNLIELVPDYEKRRELFKELEQYVVLKISDMIKHSNLSWSEYEEVLDNRFKEIMK